MKSKVAVIAWVVAVFLSQGNFNAEENKSSGSITVPMIEEWVYASETSAVIYWQTENPSNSYVEYGESTGYGQKTKLTEISPLSTRPYWSQFHRITGLKPGKTYHYRMISIGTDSKELKSADKTFDTVKVTGAIRIPDDVQGPPYVLDKENAVYILTKNITVPYCAFVMKAGVTLELDGHTVIYNEEKAAFKDDKASSVIDGEDAPFGIKSLGKKKKTIRNGVIKQGKGNNGGNIYGMGVNPLYSYESPVDVSGMEIIWDGGGISGFVFHLAGGNYVHHSVFEDKGNKVTNRHQAISTVDGNGYGSYDHVLVKSTRHQGLIGSTAAIYCEVYVDSYCTNSFGIGGNARAGKPVVVSNNKIFGHGQHPVGVGAFGMYKEGIKIFDNYIEVECTRAGDEYGWGGSAGIRSTWGGDNIDAYNNVIVGYCSTHERGKFGVTGQTRNIWIGLPIPKDKKGEVVGDGKPRAIFHENLLIARGRDATAKAGNMCVVCGNESPNLSFVNNVAISTWTNVLLSDNYGDSGAFPKFSKNTFMKEGVYDTYSTIKGENPYANNTATFLMDNVFKEGASIDSINVPGANGDKFTSEIRFQKLVEIVVVGQDGKPLEDT